MKSILLIEDDPFLIDIYNTKLKEAGFSVEIATDGEEGLKKLAEKKFDLLILDIVLPQITGWEILEEIRDLKFKDKKLKNLKIMVLSNLGQKEEVEKGINLGATKYLIKAHYTPSEIVKEIKEMLTNDNDQ
jgi:DNA-binding response OmpR family regulator